MNLKKLLLTFGILSGLASAAFATGGKAGGTLMTIPRAAIGSVGQSDYIGYYSTTIPVAAGSISSQAWTVGGGTIATDCPIRGTMVLKAVTLITANRATGSGALWGSTTDFLVIKDTWQSVQNSTAVYFMEEAFRIYDSVGICPSSAPTNIQNGYCPSAGNPIVLNPPLRLSNGLSFMISPPGTPTAPTAPAGLGTGAPYVAIRFDFEILAP